MRKKAIRDTIVALASLAGVFVVACSLSKNDNATDGTSQTSINVPSDTPIVSSPKKTKVPAASPQEISPMPTLIISPETSENDVTTEIPIVPPPETPQNIESINILSDDTVRFAGVEGEFSTFKNYYTDGLPFGNYSRCPHAPESCQHVAGIGARVAPESAETGWIPTNKKRVIYLPKDKAARCAAYIHQC